jgi:hypothetical protein
VPKPETASRVKSLMQSRSFTEGDDVIDSEPSTDGASFLPTHTKEELITGLFRIGSPGPWIAAKGVMLQIVKQERRKAINEN